MNSKIPVLAALFLVALPLAADEQPAVAYPDGYRTWYHVKSMVIEQGHPLFDAFGGIHHVYADPGALEGYRTGQFPDGARIVFDLLEAQSAEHAIVEGPRKVLGVMQKDQQRFAATGGWGFEAFGGDSQTERVVGARAKDACFSCHAAEAAPDFVFSELTP